MPPKLTITEGLYETREGDIALIERIDGNRAYGRRANSQDTTWWYAKTGEHGLYVPDDLIKRITPKSSSPPDDNPTEH